MEVFDTPDLKDLERISKMWGTVLSNIRYYMEELDIDDEKIDRAINECADLIGKYTNHLFKYKLLQRVKIKASNGYLCIGHILDRKRSVWNWNTGTNLYHIKYLSGHVNNSLEEKYIIGLDIIGAMKEKKR